MDQSRAGPDGEVGRALASDAGHGLRASDGRVELAIVGLGAWGLSVLERAVDHQRTRRSPVVVHVVQPGTIGGGVYATDQPDYLILNNACGQLSLYVSQDNGVPEPPYALGLFEWAVRNGYRWVGHECRVAPRGEPIEKTDYLPRRLMGEYLSWFYSTLVASAPASLAVVHHDALAVDVEAIAGGRERLRLSDGSTVDADHVVITSGHTWNDEPRAQEDGVDYQRPYPVRYFETAFPPATRVAVSGLGLVAFDMVTAMTLGRGGTYVDDGSRKRYLRSGREPEIHLYSRSGIPYCAKPVHGIDPTGAYEPVVCTPASFEALRRTGGMRRQVDFRADLLPLLLDEMSVRYLTHSARRRDGDDVAQAVTERLRSASRDGSLAEAVAALSARYGIFHPESHLFAGADRRYGSTKEYEADVYEMVAADLAEALDVHGSPVKAAQEVTRILRDQLRSVLEYGGLSLDSYLDFQSNVRGRINRLEAGPPPLRSQQLLALMDEGIVRVPYGPSPEVRGVPGGGIVVRSTQLDQVHSGQVLGVVRGHLDLPSLARSASPLLRRLYATGRLTQLSYGETPVGSVAINEDFHPFDVEGRVQPHLSLLGVLTEGTRYFTHYLPSPKSRLRAVLDAQACIAEALG